MPSELCDPVIMVNKLIKLQIHSQNYKCFMQLCAHINRGSSEFMWQAE